MENKKKFFIANVNSTILNMPANYNGYRWHDYAVSFNIKDNIITTKVDDKEYVDALPMKGSRRDRKTMANLVCEHICETWGTSMQEISDYADSFLAELNELLGI